MGYGRTLFTRMMKIYKPVKLLIQYRCHPKISSICSKYFYDNKVKDGIAESDRSPLYNMPTVCLFDCHNGTETIDKNSYSNFTEAATVVSLVQYLLKMGVSKEEIGVICFYKGQVELINDSLKDSQITVSTVDAFQGDEKDVIIISTTRVKKTTFMDTESRINVAFSRAKRHLFVVSNSKMLQNSTLWSGISYTLKRLGTTKEVTEPPTSAWKPF
jgi:superfamily I DNA and/or RNA helicase